MSDSRIPKQVFPLRGLVVSEIKEDNTHRSARNFRLPYDYPEINQVKKAWLQILQDNETHEDCKRAIQSYFDRTLGSLTNRQQACWRVFLFHEHYPGFNKDLR